MCNNDEQICRICGLDQKEVIWENGIYPSYGICDCCGVEFGYEDNNIFSIRNYRRKWIDNGAIWFNPEIKPKYWDLNFQLNNIIEKYK